ncbi:MAG: hypothetical protein ACXAC7_21205, partial [Candidatus Hodarchaeales archaeon]
MGYDIMNETKSINEDSAVHSQFIYAVSQRERIKSYLFDKSEWKKILLVYYIAWGLALGYAIYIYMYWRIYDPRISDIIDNDIGQPLFGFFYFLFPIIYAFYFFARNDLKYRGDDLFLRLLMLCALFFLSFLLGMPAASAYTNLLYYMDEYLTFALITTLSFYVLLYLLIGIIPTSYYYRSKIKLQLTYRYSMNKLNQSKSAHN